MMLRLDGVYYCAHKNLVWGWGSKAKCKDCYSVFGNKSDVLKSARVNTAADYTFAGDWDKYFERIARV